MQRMAVTGDKSLEDELGYALALIRKHRSQFERAADAEFAAEWLTLKYGLLGKTASLDDALQLGLRHPLSVLKRAVYAIPMAASRASMRKLYQSE